MESLPTGSVLMLRLANPSTSVAAPIALLLDRKVTVPVGVPYVEVTVAVKVTLPSKIEVFVEALSAMAEVALVMLSDSVAEVLAL